MTVSRDPKCRVMFLSPDLGFFLSHRLPIAEAALENGYHVCVATPKDTRQADLREMGFETVSVNMARGSLNPLKDMLSLVSILKAMQQWRPDIMHLITSKSIIYGGFAARILRTPALAAMTGLGYAFTHNTVKVRMLRFILILLYRNALNRKHVHVVFQNNDDLSEAVTYNLIKKPTHSIIPGSGTDLSGITAHPLPEGPLVAILPARMLRDKGVVEFVHAAQMLKQEGSDVRFVLQGDPDPSNPTSLTKDELLEWAEAGIVEWRPYTDGIAAILAAAHLVVLPSYREGFPKTLIDAAAAGRAAIASDVPGCRDAISVNVTGMLFKPKSAEALRDCLANMLSDRDRLRMMGIAARHHAEKYFDIKDVCLKHLEIYDDLKSRKNALITNGK